MSSYSVYTSSDKIASLSKFECKVIATAHKDLDKSLAARPNADDGKLRNFRLALSVTGEYTSYFGGTKALGWLTSLTLVTGTLTNLILLPVLIKALSKKKKK